MGEIHKHKKIIDNFHKAIKNNIPSNQIPDETKEELYDIGEKVLETDLSVLTSSAGLVAKGKVLSSIQEMLGIDFEMIDEEPVKNVSLGVIPFTDSVMESTPIVAFGEILFGYALDKKNVKIDNQYKLSTRTVTRYMRSARNVFNWNFNKNDCLYFDLLRIYLFEYKDLVGIDVGEQYTFTDKGTRDVIANNGNRKMMDIFDIAMKTITNMPLSMNSKLAFGVLGLILSGDAPPVSFSPPSAPPPKKDDKGKRDMVDRAKNAAQGMKNAAQGMKKLGASAAVKMGIKKKEPDNKDPVKGANAPAAGKDADKSAGKDADKSAGTGAPTGAATGDAKSALASAKSSAIGAFASAKSGTGAAVSSARSGASSAVSSARSGAKGAVASAGNLAKAASIGALGAAGAAAAGTREGPKLLFDGATSALGLGKGGGASHYKQKRRTRKRRTRKRGHSRRIKCTRRRAKMKRKGTRKRGSYKRAQRKRTKSRRRRKVRR